MQRYELLKQLIDEGKFERIAEVGVREGETAKFLTKNCESIKEYYNVDIKNLLCPKEFPLFIELPSVEAAKHFRDGYLDLVFIDADHSYEAVVNDLYAWGPKVRRGGVLCGHDYLNPAHRGVEKAIKLFFGSVEEHEDCYMWVKRV